MCRGNFACKCTKGFNLSISQFDNFQKIEVFNITGRRIFLSDVRNKELFKGAIKDLPEGIYFLRITTKKKIHIKKITLGTK